MKRLFHHQLHQDQLNHWFAHRLKRRRGVALLGALFLSYLFIVSPALGQEATPLPTPPSTSSSGVGQEPSAPRQTLLSDDSLDLAQKPRLSERELKKKREGSYFTGAAGPGASPDSGWGGSVVGFWYYNGDQDDILFPYTPYLHSIGMIVSYMSKGYFNTGIRWDAPFFMRSNFRLTVEAQLFLNPVAQYYGTGSASLAPLELPDGTVYTRMEDYEAALKTISGGATDSHYNYYDSKDYYGKVQVQRSFAGGIFRVLGGLNFRYVDIADYSFHDVTVNSADGSSAPATQNETLLHKDYAAGKITGLEGGWNNSLMLGLAYDTRDLEPFARKGMFHDISLMHTTKILGSVADYTELTSALRFYWSPFSEIDLVLGSRLSYTMRFGDIPFYAMTQLQYTDKQMNAMGGMRGFRDRRFMGPFVALGNFEARWTFWTLTAGEEIFDFTLAPFVDVGRVYDTLEQTTLEELKYSYGAGLRLTWNQATVICFDFGFSEEDFGFYLTINQVF